MNKRTTRLFIIVMCLFGLAVGFQNCGKVKKRDSSNNYSASSSHNPANGSDMDPDDDDYGDDGDYDDGDYDDGDYDDGDYDDGDYDDGYDEEYGDCRTPWGGYVMDGDSIIAYKSDAVGPGQSCESNGNSQIRVCNNGVLSGSDAYQYEFCTPDQEAMSCKLPWDPSYELLDGESIQVFKIDKGLSWDNDCDSPGNMIEMTCSNGELEGYKAGYQKDYCEPYEPGLSCIQDDIELADGESATFFKQEILAAGQNCMSASNSQLRVCKNGVLSGSFPYAGCETVAAKKKNCKIVYQNGNIRQKELESEAKCTQFYLSAPNQGKIKKVMFGKDKIFDPSDANGKSCVLDGKTVLNGGTANFFKSKTVAAGESCASVRQQRTCKKGVLSGNDAYKYASCSVKEAKDCSLDGKTVKHGKSATFYTNQSVAAGKSCDSVALTRTCNDGKLSGNNQYQYSSCTVKDAKSCTLDGKTLKDGQSAKFYMNQTVAAGKTCDNAWITRTCSNGKLSGSDQYKYSSCTVKEAKSCTLDGKTLKDGQSAKFYTNQSVAYGKTCDNLWITRTCNDGKLSSSDQYKYSSCTVKEPKDCTLDGKTVKHGKSHTFYTDQTVAYGKVCANFGLSRTCNNGELSGASHFKYASCSVKAPKDCSLDGKNVKHGDGAYFFSTQSVNSKNKKCEDVRKWRKCDNGTLSGDATFKYGSCKEK